MIEFKKENFKFMTIDENGQIGYSNSPASNCACSEMTQSEIDKMRNHISNLNKMEECLQYLEQTDYIAIKFAEGVISLSEFEPIREKRKEMRKKINELEKYFEN